MNVTIAPGRLSGMITPPPSKSESHRLILGAALCEGVSTLENMAFSQDIEATIRAMTALGARFQQTGSQLQVTGLFHGGKPPEFSQLPRLDCGESGSTLRFLIPVALAVAGGGVFTGQGRLMERPQTPYEELFREKGISMEMADKTLTVQGKLKPGTFLLPGNVSSQFFTGLLYALPLLQGDSKLVSTTTLESSSYLAMTLESLGRFRVLSQRSGMEFLVPGKAQFLPTSTAVGADWSNGAFWVAAQYLGSHLHIHGLDDKSAQGDRMIMDFATRLAAGNYQEIDVSDCPDLVPPLAVMAALGNGQTHIVGAARLRIKESDRLATVTATLRALGARIEEKSDCLVIRGVDALSGGTVDGCNDHRIAMMAAIAATRAKGMLTITGAQCVEKSYPNFWEDFKALGGNVL